MLSRLEVAHFRNLTNVSIRPCEQFNIFFGKNGSGKTSLLEAINYLSLARSFRTHVNQHVIQDDCDQLSVFGEVLHHSIGLVRNTHQGFKIKIDSEEVQLVSELARLLPIQLINSDTFELLHGGSKIRRQFLDWGLFHVKQDSFLLLWRKLQRVLQQRNAVLKNETNYQSLRQQIKYWDAELTDISMQVHDIRQEYFSVFLKEFYINLEYLLPGYSVDMHYYAGWNLDKELNESLEENFRKDCGLGYTTVGAHKADIKIKIDNVPAKDILSRGQQKLLVCAMQLTQAEIMHQLSEKHCVFLIDDLPSELDDEKRSVLIQLIDQLNSQVFITGIQKESFDKLMKEDSIVKLFHVERGEIIELKG